MTRQQSWSCRAAQAVQRVQAAHRRDEKTSEAEYLRFAKGFPALVHNSGLCQALAFALAKKRRGYAEDLAYTLGLSLSAEELLELSRTASAASYLRLSREVLAASSWLKRYAEALLKDDEQNQEGEEP
ncbi:MAG: type III-B CRISPR module-associated protein Cmr5 [Bacillota bacterium]|nr:type III-B CRISPR module-associated protein Cmr5 [Bacillota bacterium]